MTLYNDSLEGVYLVFNPTDFGTLSRAMTEGYGAPTRMEQEVLQTRAGATFQNEMMTWQRRDAQVDLRKYGASVDEGRVTIVAETALAEFRRRSREGVSKGAKDL